MIMYQFLVSLCLWAVTFTSVSQIFTTLFGEARKLEGFGVKGISLPSGGLGSGKIVSLEVRSLLKRIHYSEYFKMTTFLSFC